MLYFTLVYLTYSSKNKLRYFYPALKFWAWFLDLSLSAPLSLWHIAHIHISISICTSRHTCTFLSGSTHRPCEAQEVSHFLFIMPLLLPACWFQSMGIDLIPLFPLCNTLPGIPACKTISQECPTFSESLLSFVAFSHAIPSCFKAHRQTWGSIGLTKRRKYIFHCLRGNHPA